MKIPEETQSGKRFRLRGKGVKPVRGGPVGDLYCEAVVATPVKRTPRPKNLLREFAQSVRDGGKGHSPQAHSWLDGVKDFFESLKA